MSRTAVSVIVVNHNGRDYLDRCLDAVFAAEPSEVLVVDSGSTDGSGTAAAEKYPVRLLSLGANRGPSAARNFGLREASCDTVLLIDNDVELLPGCLETLLAHLESRPDMALIQARSVLAEADGPVHYDGGEFHMLGLISLRNWYVPQADAAGSGLEETDVAISLCCVGRRQALLEAGGYDEEMFILFEDLAISYALKLRGHKVGIAADAMCIHKAGTAGLSTRGEASTYAANRSFLHSRNRWIFLLTHYRAWTLLVLVPAFCLYGFVHLGFVVLSGHLAAWFRGKVAVCRLFSYLRRRRRKIQAGRACRDVVLLGCPELTFNPGLAKRGFRSVVGAVLGGSLRLYYACVRWVL